MCIRDSYSYWRPNPGPILSRHALLRFMARFRVKSASLWRQGHFIFRTRVPRLWCYISHGGFARTACESATGRHAAAVANQTCLLYTSDAADEEDSVDLGGR